MSDRELWKRLKEVFAASYEMPIEERDAYLEAACAGDGKLLARARALLAPDPEAAARLDTPALGQAVLRPPSGGDSLVGRSIGAYRILREIGEGGMGTAYLACRNDDQYQQQVAIKLVRRGMSTGYFQGRFRQERQILASLQHPNIARLLDGGVTEEGWPYCVLEYVEGEAIDIYCDRQGLGIDQRLRLFESVCSAVHYAHRNLIVHCDLKPSNILVTAEGVPKLLDFGIAKLLHPDLDDAMPTLTLGPRMLTPEYASPEQVSGRPITTASDVYSLGVVLFQLLTGRRPYDVASRSPRDVERVICEGSVQRPSNSIAREDGEASSLPPFDVGLDAHPAKLRRRLRGDLDNITLMALRKEPGRRYGSVEQLQEDLQRHRRRRPVLAMPDTVGYRVGKFVRRHPLGVALFLALLSSSFALQAMHEKARRSDKISINSVQLVRATFEGADPYGMHGIGLRPVRFLHSAEEAIRDLEIGVLVQAELLDIMGVAYKHLGYYKKAIEVLRDALRIRQEELAPEHPDVATSLSHLGVVLWRNQELEEAREHLERSLELRRAADAGEEKIADSLNGLALVLWDQGSKAEAEALLREAQEGLQQAEESNPLALAATLNNLGNLLRVTAGGLEEAARLHQWALELRQAQWPDGHALVGDSLNNLGAVLEGSGHLDEARESHLAALAMWRDRLGREHPRAATSLHNLGRILVRLSDFSGARERYEEALEIQRYAFPEGHLDMVKTLSDLGFLEFQSGAMARAEEHWSKALSVHGEPPAVADSQELANLYTGLGMIRKSKGALREAKRRFTQAEAVYLNLGQKVDAEEMEGYIQQLDAELLALGETP